jgi:hypothetical protein
VNCCRPSDANDAGEARLGQRGRGLRG